MKWTSAIITLTYFHKKNFKAPTEFMSYFCLIGGYTFLGCGKDANIHQSYTCKSETSEILVSREFSRIFFHFHFSFSISSRFNFTFHFSKKVKAIGISLFFLEKKRVKLGLGYNLTSIFDPNCISKDSQISSKYKLQNIGQISVLKSWPTPMPHVCTRAA